MGEFYKSDDRKGVNPFDRYKNCKILTDTETGEVLLSTREITKIKLSVDDRYHTVQANEVGRLDLIAYNYYGNPLLWWVIAQANDIYDPFNAPEVNTMIRIPSLVKMYDYEGVLQ